MINLLCIVYSWILEKRSQWFKEERRQNDKRSWYVWSTYKMINVHDIYYNTMLTQFSTWKVLLQQLFGSYCNIYSKIISASRHSFIIYRLFMLSLNAAISIWFPQHRIKTQQIRPLMAIARHFRFIITTIMNLDIQSTAC